MKKSIYAKILWSVEDIKIRKGKWTTKQCEDWLEKHEKELQDVAIEAGNTFIDWATAE